MTPTDPDSSVDDVLQRRRAIAAALIAGATWPQCMVALAQDVYPSRPVKIIAPQAPGGGVDLVARVIAERLRLALGQTFLVENVAGAGGSIATQATARARPDGYTLMIGYVATHATTPAVKRRPGYDAIRDFTPVGLMARFPMILA
jgi:tripartite-type tricarboxylate transporter receptor subunit TctC